ncbi:MAG: hypothetical protein ACXWBQ_14825, partial [Usitatibacter sp.]
MSALTSPTHVGRIGAPFALLLIASFAIASSLSACSVSLNPPSRKVLFVNFNHERARFAFERFESACRALG